MQRSTTTMILCGLVLIAWTAALTADELKVHTFARHQLTDTYFSEGANAGDLNGDHVPDVVYGPYWYAGPDYRARHEIYKPVPQNTAAYADNFFSWIYDFNADGWNDVLVAGFPGTPAYVYENPGQGDAASPKPDQHWTKHQVYDWVSNESPQFVNLIGDDRPELICTRDGYFGFVTVNWEEPFGDWTFHPISEQITATRFGHGLGIGDVNGDGRMDIIHSQGWFEQPASKADQVPWSKHDVAFTNSYGGAEMYAYDVDGDGDNDIITGLAAHDFGLVWFEQAGSGDKRSFKQHMIMGSHPSENRYGLVFSEPHSISLVDMDGDGLKDIVTGKTYWSHHKQAPMWDAPAVVYWFRLVRNKDGVDWIPYKADDSAGIGRQVSVVDVNKDGLPDIVVGGMKGAHVLIQSVNAATKAEWEAQQPKLYEGEKLPSVEGAEARRGAKSPIDGTTGLAPNAIEGERLNVRPSSGKAVVQPMGNFQADRWSNNTQLFWTQTRPGDRLAIPLPPCSGTVNLDVVLTCARDYGIIELSIDGETLGKPIDLYHPEVITTGVLSFPKLVLKDGRHVLTVRILGSNPRAVHSYLFGLDYLRIQQADGSFVKGPVGRAASNAARDPAAKPVRARTTDGRPLNLDFETGTLKDWTPTGEAFAQQPVKDDLVIARRQDMRSGHTGQFWVGGYEKLKDAATGTLTSLPFIVSHPFATFLANGGDSDATRVELIRKDTGEVFYKISGTNSETMRRVVVDLRGHVGKEVMIRLVDESQAGWGHLNFDDFRLYETRPGPVTPPAITLVADDYPFSGLSAKKAAEAMKVPEGFSVRVGAAEPDVQQPIAMALDDRGRVWIAEAYEYPVRAKGDQGRDRILVFEDTDGDGTLDKRTVFFEGLNLVSGLEVGFGGVWVGAAPYLLFIPDKNGDDVPDSKPQVLLDGWGFQDTHETLNAFIWGPDGWLYGCHGVFTHSRVGKPGTPDEERIPINAGVWRYHPTRQTFEVFGYGTSNPWGIDFDDHGQAFITACVIPHLYHIIQGARYQRQGGQHFNPYVYRDIVTIADHLHYLGVTPHSGNDKSDAVGGGHAHAGAMIYLGGRWPESYRDQIIMNNIHGQRLNMDLLKPVGSGYTGSHGPDFLLTGDRASQILNLRYGPDGDAWMIDWYDMQACHTRDPRVPDRSNGRIYKVVYGQQDQQPDPIDLAALSDAGLAELVLEENDFYVRHARRRLQERAAERAIRPDAIEFLINVASTNSDDTRRLRAAWALHVTGNLSVDLSERLLEDPSPYVRGWAIQLRTEKQGAEVSDEFLARLTSMAREDASPIVRLYLASFAQRIAPSRRWELLSTLADHPDDATDHNLPLMYWYAAEPLAELDNKRALAWALKAGQSIPVLREFMLRRIGSSDGNSPLQVLVDGLAKVNETDLKLSFLRALRTALRGQRRVNAPAGWSELSASLLEDDDGEIQLQATALGVTFGDPIALKSMRTQVLDQGVPVPARLVALQSLLDAHDPQLVATLKRLLDADAPLRTAAIQGLARYDDASIPETLLALYPELPPLQKRQALSTLCARPASGVALLHAIENDQIAGVDLTADLVRQLQFLRNDEISGLLQTVWGTVRSSAADRVKMIAEYQELVASTGLPKADVELGRAVFAKTCMKCHILFGIGNKVGPDLTGANRSDLNYLLSNVVDPSAVMANEYRPTNIVTMNGRVVTGLIQAEDGKTITIHTGDEELVLPIDELDVRELSEKSMMPDDQLKQFSQHEIRSLFTYLQSKTQTPMLATVENSLNLFNGQDLTGWSGRDGLWTVEDGELVGRTDGLTRNEWIVSDLSADNFQFTVDVKLVDNLGNSGIQFRSHAQNGEVAGYQADIGEGWWGKLYEEHGRALLWNKSGEQHVKPGEWNTYTVVAEGSHIRTTINGHPCVDLDDPKGARRGILAFQLHSGGKTEVRFRNLQLTVIGSAEATEGATASTE